MPLRLFAAAPYIMPSEAHCQADRGINAGCFEKFWTGMLQFCLTRTDIVEQLNTKGVQLVSNKENIDSGTPTGKLLLTMIGAINEFERVNLLERQREGIAIAKRNGKYKGGKRKAVNDFAEHYARYKEREITKSALARELGISRPTLDKLIGEYKEKNND